jgi:hypothetical protein
MIKNFTRTNSHHYNWEDKNKTKENCYFPYIDNEMRMFIDETLELLVLIKTRIVFLAKSNKDSDSVYSSINRVRKLQ